MVDVFSPDQAVLSFGLGGNVDFDLQMARSGHPIHMYDHTIADLPDEHPLFHYSKEGVAGASDPATALYSIEDHLARKGIAGDRLILKIDVEGAEWQTFHMMSDAVLARFEQIVIEIHCLTQIGDEGVRALVSEVLSKFNRHFTLFHIHANNNAPIRIVDGLPVCDVMELSYVKTDIVKRKPSRTTYPTALDAANKVGTSDYVLGFFPFLPISNATALKACADRVMDHKRSTEAETIEAFARAVEHHQAGRWLEARASYRQVLSILPDDVSSLNNLSLLVDDDEALKLLRRALSQKPDHVDALCNLFRIQLKAGNVQAAHVCMEHVKVLAPDNALAAAYMAFANPPQGMPAN
jgi:tetratricopeptide (TPR) repeat protein